MTWVEELKSPSGHKGLEGGGSTHFLPSGTLHRAQALLQCALMKTNLPESRNRNLPGPPAHAVPVESRRRLLPPEPSEEPRRGPSALRSFVVMLVIGGLFGAGIWYYIRGAETEARANEQLFASLTMIGSEIWETTSSSALTTDSEDTQKDLEDLPRVMNAMRAWARARGLAPRIMPLEGDPPPGRGNGTHQIQFFFADNPMLIIRVAIRGDGTIYFLGETNRVTKSRKEFYESLKPEAAAPEKAPEPSTAPAAAPEEKVSEPPAKPQ